MEGSTLGDARGLFSEFKVSLTYKRKLFPKINKQGRMSSNVAQEIKVLAAKPGDFSFDPRTHNPHPHGPKREMIPKSCPVASSCCGVHVLTPHTHTHTHTEYALFPP